MRRLVAPLLVVGLITACSLGDFESSSNDEASGEKSLPQYCWCADACLMTIPSTAGCPGFFASVQCCNTSCENAAVDASADAIEPDVSDANAASD